MALQALGEKVQDVPFGTRELWNDMALRFPNIVSQLSFFTNPPKINPRPDSEWEYIVQNKAKFDQHTLKIKSPADLGIDDVKQYSGYLDVEDEDKHFFFWFFESRNDPKNDPIILWLNGGPGCSSLTGLFFELGPSFINETLQPVRNPYSWNSNASVIFLDQPVNVGYSYSSGKISDTVAAGKDVHAFLNLFFKQFPEYAEPDFHIAGESYAGHYIPVFASEILSHDDNNFNLTSVLIGNGLTDPLTQYDYYEPMACGRGGAPSVLEPEQCQDMIDAQPRCNSLINSCYESQSVWSCVPAALYCNNKMMGPYQQTGKNVYDIRTECEGGSLCYIELDWIDKYLNTPEVKRAVGAEVDTYEGCNFDVNRNFLFAGDWMKPYHTAVITLLEQGLPVLIYAGDKDFICNWLGNEAWTKELEWSGKKEFGKAPIKSWTVDGEEVGKVTNYEHFTFLRVYEAGHMVPADQGKASLNMLNRWINGEYSYK
ncbi:peptidase S10, serine carboxypeptidase [Nadsonia fulvescens var. elongata DSM 6958]|uniref:Carboxypeptidase n=1 Tax=Nadsonia fulvescens var. elongata DSM 6958 TaxID=857566 RepID=A0A1E3PLB8_9ASCO|nr:peptidase S10, serine carboxypeptidase [Nadsonia fulvescens var. elongata DSM 6958]